MQKIKFLLLLILMLPSTKFFAREIVFHRYSVDDGMPSSMVNVVFQSHTGFIWFGTKEGLARFDGHNIVPIPLPDDDFDQISKLRITSLCEDDDHNLWIGTTYGVLCYNQLTEKFKHYLFDEENPLDLSRFVNYLTFSDEWGLWAGTRNGIFYLDKEKDQFVVYPHFAHHNEFKSITMGERIVNALFFDRLGYLWVGTAGNGINRLNLKEHSKQVFLHEPNNPSTPCSNFVETIFEDSFGVLWFGTTIGLARFDREKESFYCITKGNGKFGLSDDHVTSIMEDTKGNLYIGTKNGLDYYKRREEEIVKYQHYPHDLYSISSSIINCCFHDRSGTYWVGTMHGANSFSYRNHHFDLYQSVPNDKSTLANNMLRTIVADKQGNIWMGTQNEGIERFDRRLRRFFHYRQNSSAANHILTSFLSGAGELYFGTEEGILKYNQPKDRFDLFDFGGIYEFSDRGIYEIVEDKYGNLYFSEMDRGIFRYDKNSKKIEKLDLHLDQIDPSRVNNIKVMHIDSSGKLWFSLQMSGVGRYDLETGHTEHWNKEDNGLASNQVWDIFENEKGIWLGTENGLCFYNDSTNTFDNFNIQDGLPGPIVVSILEDDNKHLWLGTNKGLSYFEPENRTFVNYSGSDGLQGEIFEYKVKQKIGELLLFGGNNGFNVFNPNEFTRNPYIPVPRFTNLSIFKHTVSPNQKVGGNIPLKRSMVFEEQINLKDSHEDIEIEFSAFSYVDSDKNSYKYYFAEKGDTAAWTYTTGEKNSLSFSSLKPGDYELRIKAANCDGIWSEEPVSVTIKVTRDLRKLIGYISNAFLVLVIAVLLIYFRKVLKQFLPEWRRKKQQPDSAHSLPRFKLDPHLDPRTKKDLQLLIESMERERLFLDKRLTKIQLAAHLKISLAQLSKLLKEQLDVGFNDFVNYYRVEAVKEMMSDPKNKDFTLLSIAEDCGFNSKTSFYRIFKNFMGLTPAEYFEKYVEVPEKE
ncbi:ligand-binding sensor domain-containing protein [Mariniphaga anaerophila]|uniref:Ligand-binding sensor domain-containing protein n=1 Tax=Mariniphaga anaerophila TaxID=1484053 RepID=A0A1M4SED5_9BACT|nr:two-component regulator propeller domain-containing protein [Mariniphaga anaerophila]SHE30556.1 ligand-binding sensor domain-containing protein [Mariniphaga anaerophila]